MTDLATAILISNSVLTEDTTINTLVGFRFIDSATGSAVVDGIDVTTRPTDATGPFVSGYRTTSGSVAFRGLPGMRALEYDLEPELGGSPPEARSFVFFITDSRQRFVPAVRRLELPRSAQASPPDSNLLEFFLVSAPSRTVPPGFAAVYTQLVDADAHIPVQHAVLEIEAGGETYFGISDADGNVGVFFPYPAISITLSGSPPAGETALLQQTWDLNVRVRYQPGALDFPHDSDYPEVASVFGQTGGTIRESTNASPPVSVDVKTETLRFGRPCIIRTDDLATLFIEST